MINYAKKKESYILLLHEAQIKNGIIMNVQERYEDLYIKVQNEALKRELIATTLMELCSCRVNTINQEVIDVEVLLDTSFQAKKFVQDTFNELSKKAGFTMNYVNIIGKL